MTTTHPSNTSELQLFRVLQRANLLQYYETFIAQGGDDVQQLCEAGEEEFLEIMALVGMASKPLHVRRLQKALQEWVTNPGVLQPIVPPSGITPTSHSMGVHQQSLPQLSPTATPTPNTSTTPTQAPRSSQGNGNGSANHNHNNVVSAPTWSPQPAASVSPYSSQSVPSPNNNSHDSAKLDFSTQIKQEYAQLQKEIMASTVANYTEQCSDPKGSSTSPVPLPVLADSQIQAVAEAAARLAKTLPAYEPKFYNMKKQMVRELEHVMSMPIGEHGRMDHIRKWSAIYGRFDSKRKNEKPMSLHEISVNEAAAQLCSLVTSLLTRREDLFPLARQVVKDSGYQYSKGHSRSNSDVVAQVAKRAKMDSAFQRHHELLPGNMQAEVDKIKLEASEKLAEIASELAAVQKHQEETKAEIQEAQKEEENIKLLQDLQARMEQLTSKQLGLLTEQSDVIRKQRRAQRLNLKRYREEEAGNTDDSNLPSGCSSPQNGLHGGEGGEYPDCYPSPAKRSALNTRRFVQESLFDEGLRIAQQYGMSDFAAELAGLKSESGSENGDEHEQQESNGVTNDNGDPQKEWMEEVELDAKRQAKHSPVNGNSSPSTEPPGGESEN